MTASTTAAVLVEQAQRLEAQVDALLAENRLLAGREVDMIRRAYRRGYLAGRSAQRRGAPAVTNPERTARGWVREALASR